MEKSWWSDSKAAAQVAGEAISPIDDIRTATYRQAVTKTAIERSLVGLSEGFVPNPEVGPLLGWNLGQSVPSQSEISTLSEIACEVNGTSLPPHWALTPSSWMASNKRLHWNKRVALKVNVRVHSSVERFGGDELPYPDSTSRRRAGGNY